MKFKKTYDIKLGNSQDMIDEYIRLLKIEKASAKTLFSMIARKQYDSLKNNGRG
tara:strand:+ start:12365 stop:12526 length:162 start_codon:yes stop_codon:yes gene_type:complete